MHTDYHAPQAPSSKEQLEEKGGVPILSTQREQLWAVDKAAMGEGATLQAMAATRKPTQREQLWAVGATAGEEGVTLLHH